MKHFNKKFEKSRKLLEIEEGKESLRHKIFLRRVATSTKNQFNKVDKLNKLLHNDYQIKARKIVT